MNQLVRRAELLMQQMRFELAEEQLKAALVEDSDDAHAHALLAICLTEREAYDEAASEASQAVHAAPDNAFSHFAMAVVMQSRNRPAEARQSISEAIRLEPWEALYFGRLSAIESGASRWSDALAAAEKGLELDPENIQCNNLRAIALTKLGRRAEAGQSINAALKRDPDNAVTHANEGWRLLHERQPKNAMEHFREALRLDPNLEWARLGIVEAMKARNFFYRLLLAFFLWVNRFPPKVQLMLVIGLVLGNNILHGVTRAIPAIAPLSTFIAIFYVLFVWVTWSASTLFNLVLWTNPFGRLALNRNEKGEAAFCGLCVLAAAVGCLACVTFWPFFVEQGLMSSLLFLGLVIPIVSAFRAKGDRRKIAVAWTLGVSAIVIAAMTLWFVLPLRIISVKSEFVADGESTLELESKLGQLADDLKGLTGEERQAKITQHPDPRIPKIVAGIGRLVDQHGTVWQYGLWGIVLSTWLGFGMSLAPQKR